LTFRKPKYWLGTTDVVVGDMRGNEIPVKIFHRKYVDEDQFFVVDMRTKEILSQIAILKNKQIVGILHEILPNDARPIQNFERLPYYIKNALEKRLEV
jgi:hypothetical protein